MRFYPFNTILLACFVGVFLQVAARAVPALDPNYGALIPRGGRFPSLGIPSRPATPVTPKPAGVNKPPVAIRPNEGNSPKSPTAACKRADAQGCNINSYGPIDMDFSEDFSTASGHLRWAPAEEQDVAPTLTNLAKRLYHELKVSDSQMFVEGGDIVGALYVPERGVFLSTTPRDDAARRIVSDFKEKAPGLYKATNGRRSRFRGTPNALHVEDGVIYKYETFDDSYRIQEGGEFPGGSTLAMYGAYTKNGKDQHVVPCKGAKAGEQNRYPSCKTVLQRLKISVVQEDGSVR
ncbi:hypothetical protein BDV06DRAFT_227806 [Aspergillus oleicola]